MYLFTKIVFICVILNFVRIKKFVMP